MKTKTNESQVGGTHYEFLQVEPIRLIVAFKFNWFQGEILKYVSRFPRKGGKQDLTKAAHISQMAVDFKITDKRKKNIRFTKVICEKRYLADLVDDFCKQFEDYKEYVTVILIGLIEENYSYVKEQVIKLSIKQYGKEEDTIS